MDIHLNRITKTIGSFVALSDVNLTIPDGKLVVILGPSGSGKTTLLRIMAGMEDPDEGSGPIVFGQQDVSHHGVSKRGVGFVFQHYALFRHMTVFENVAFGLRVMPRETRPSDKKIREKVMQLLDLVQLSSLANRHAHHLSGGQRQRVALARALAIEPKILLLDEPFGALDAKVRQDLRRWLRHLHQDINVTSVLVTHDQEEALEVADLVVVMHQGQIEQVGSPDEIYHAPQTEFVMDFIGHVNELSGTVENGRALFGTISIPAGPDYAGQKVRLFVRPHDIEIKKQFTDGPVAFDARISHVQTAGPLSKIALITDSGEALLVELPHYRFLEDGFHVGQSVQLRFREFKMFAETSHRPLHSTIDTLPVSS